MSKPHRTPRVISRFVWGALFGLGVCAGCFLHLESLAASRLPDAWDTVLGQAGLTKESARFDLLDMANYGGREFGLPFFDAVHQEPLRIPFYSRTLRQNVSAASSSLSELVMLGGLRIGEGTRRTLIGDPLADIAKRCERSAALADAIAAAYETGKAPLKPAALRELSQQVARVPADVAKAAALILFTELEALKWRERAFAGIPPAERARLFNLLIGENPDDDRAIDSGLLAAMHKIDLKYLLVGAEDLALAVDRASTTLANRAGREAFNLQWTTPLGRIALTGSQNMSYSSGSPTLLIVDTGGDDQYFTAGSTFDAGHPVSVALDVSGDDRYIQRSSLAAAEVAKDELRKKDHQPEFGSGILGYGFLVDVQGDDIYRGFSSGQGRGCFGIGALQDKKGNDQYDCYSLGQGSARFGVGILADNAGADEYRCFLSSQGFGDTKGFGILIDGGAGDDRYEANDTVIDFPSAQDKKHNSSLSQGCGFGRRADYLDGHSLAGGLGVLQDDGGQNRFTAGLFAQGAGYWYGAGFLLAGPADDTYRGVWYVQGASAHFAVGVLDDAGGNDSYIATLNMAQGAGHDFGPGFLVDRSGNDRYEAPNLSLGGGNANGFGFFWDVSGSDTYVVRPSTTLGRASIEASGRGSIRERNLTLGVFLDSGGSDTYPSDLGWARNNRGWTMTDSGAPPIPTMRGAGLDMESPATAEPK